MAKIWNMFLKVGVLPHPTPINSVFDYFPPHLPIVLSVVSMEVFAPRKMAEIRASPWQQGGPDPRI